MTTRVVVRTENPQRLQELLWRSHATIYVETYILPEGLRILSSATAAQTLSDLESRGILLGDCEVDERT